MLWMMRVLKAGSVAMSSSTYYMSAAVLRCSRGSVMIHVCLHDSRIILARTNGHVV